MRAIAQYQRGFVASAMVRDNKTIPAEFGVVCLWSALGLTLTALFFASGFGADIGQALVMAG